MSNGKEAKDFCLNHRARWDTLFLRKVVGKIRKKLIFFVAYLHFKDVLLYTYFRLYILETHTPPYIFLHRHWWTEYIVDGDEFYENIEDSIYYYFYYFDSGYRTSGILWELDVKIPWEMEWNGSRRGQDHETGLERVGLMGLKQSRMNRHCWQRIIVQDEEKWRDFLLEVALQD